MLADAACVFQSYRGPAAGTGKTTHRRKRELAGIELMHMISNGQFETNGPNPMSFADQFYALEGQVRPV